ncbi:hypothetical protein [Actinoallomurus iriomotensis]|uniref:hypothetical protein n=1 Tax=Actinoallomurus iriomotensis TaxID=478107 RepID=UPI002555E753|nr:hypothetical protein [Actinoallomurus iriomotensis]
MTLLAAVVAVPVGLSQRCRVFGQGCRTPRPRPKPQPRALTPLEAATRGGYVALGDSYSSGEGAWNPSSDRAYVNGGAESCHRSRQSYFPTVSQAYRFAKTGGFWACSGARTENLLNVGNAPGTASSNSTSGCRLPSPAWKTRAVSPRSSTG